MTGILMLTHARSGLINALHEWMGVLLIIFGVIHLVINWKAFMNCFRNKRRLVAVVSVAVVLALMWLGGLRNSNTGAHHSGQNDYPRGYHHGY